MGSKHANGAEGKYSERAEQDRLWFLEGMDRINQVIQDTDDIRQTNHVLDALLSIFGCDRAWLKYPCDPNSKTLRTVADCGVPAIAHSTQIGLDVPVEAAMASVLQVVSASEGPVCFVSETNEGTSDRSAECTGVRSQLCLAIRTQIDKPYMLGLDQCTRAREWTQPDQRLFEAIGRRIGALLTSLSLSRDLQESKAMLEEAQRIAHVGYWDWNLDTGEIIWSDEAYRIFGLKPQECPMDIETVSRLVHPDDREELYSTVDAEVAGGVYPVHQHRIVRPNGEVRTVQSITSKLWSAMPGDPESGAPGRPHRLFGTVQDVTELKLAEEARHSLSRDLKESKEWLEEAQRVAHLGYWVWDLETNQVIWSQETYRIFGLSPETGSLDIAKVAEMIHPEDRDAVFRTASQALISGKRADCEHRLFRPDGEVRIVHSLGDVKKTAEGRTQMFGTTQDITERKHVEEERQNLSSALHQSNSRLQEAQRVAHIGHYEFNPLENHVTWSAELCRIWGLPPTKGPLSMSLVSEMIHPDDREYAARVIEDALRSGTHLKAEHRIVRPDGNVRFLQVLGTVKRDASGCACELFGTCQDITEHRHVEDERQALSSALQQSNARLEEAQRVAHVGHFEWNLLDGRVSWSKELYRIYGLSPQEGPIDLATIFQMIHPEDRDCVAREAEEVIRNGIHSKAEHRIIRPDGEVRFIQGLGTVKRDASGRAYEMFGTSQDITERKLAEQALRRSQLYLSEGERLAHIGSWASGDLGIRWSDNLDIYWSDEVYKIFGFDPKKGPPNFQHLLAAIHPQDQAAFTETLKRMHEQHCSCDFTNRIIRPDGEIRYIRCVGIPVVEAGVFRGYHGTTMDVTTHELLTQELRRERAYMADAQSLAHIGSWATNYKTGQIHHISDETFRLHGFDPGNGPIPLDRFYDTIHPEDRPALMAAIDDAIKSGADWDLQNYRICRPDGEIRFLRAIAHRNPAEEVGYYIGITLDVTDRKRAEEERERLRQLEANLAHINRVNMMGELATALAHEIRQPISASITSANACLRWLAHDPPDLERARAAVTRIEHEGNRAADIINSLRSFYKSGAPAKPQMVDVKDAIGEMIVLLNTEAARHSVAVRSEFEAGVSCVPADRVQLQQVLMNLMLNAIEAMKETGGDLTIKTRMSPRDQLIVSISDTGEGLPADDLELIFNPFHTTKPQGTGMGLTITRSIVEAYGGRVWATANDGAGATFHFSLPAGTEAHR